MTHRLNTPEAIAKRAATIKARTHCRNGLHVRSPENTYVSPKGQRACIPCRNEAKRFRDEMQREVRRLKRLGAA